MTTKTRSPADCLRSLFAHLQLAELRVPNCMAHFVRTRDSDAFSCLMRAATGRWCLAWLAA